MDNTGEYDDLLKLKKEIDNRLNGADITTIKELLLYIDGNILFNNMKYRDTQLVILQQFLLIWLKELTENDISANIFDGVNCLKELEEKYWIIIFVILRFENKVPYDFCLQGIETLIRYQISPVAIEELIYTESEKKSNNIIDISDALLDKNQSVKAYSLLRLGKQRYPDDLLIGKKIKIINELIRGTENE